VLLTRLGIPKLWREDHEAVWPFLRRFVSPIVVAIAPSYAYGLDRVPTEGGGVVAANHLSAIDPALVGAFCPRPVIFMTKAELLAIPVVGDLLGWAGAFPVRRGAGDRESVRRARSLARQGYLVGVFVEGTRQRFGHPGPVHPGAVMIAIQEGVPVVPCGLYSFGWSLKRRRPCALVWGEPVDLSGYGRSGRGYREAAKVVGEEITRLWRIAAEAVAAGFPPALEDGSRRSGPVPPPRRRPRSASPSSGAQERTMTSSSSARAKNPRA
jgi:1-acyl-sn-glycerol-3-phosphate acyltransferase